VSLGDKISNVSGFAEAPPADWDRARIQNYAAWAYKVVRGYRGTNAQLEAKFDEVVSQTITWRGESFRLLPESIDAAPVL